MTSNLAWWLQLLRPTELDIQLKGSFASSTTQILCSRCVPVRPVRVLVTHLPAIPDLSKVSFATPNY